ncbi:MarR family transcriptional regulator [uncultured Ferrovibrio sp.]|jgi:Transcriptional regulators|uniref:MarR family winged helix-turn-helix transcriptional regulator n=1 Tax=uncultured Ferrovibrio sp. TaxID=1576913 RepID=UPI00261A0ACF|nr:MarR family transcriptional regulator [uncultured Ferrovibrio sp.]
MTRRRAQRIAAVRRFNRFYAQCVYRLDERLRCGIFSPTESRVLLELAGAEPATATALNRHLGLDRSYLSRILYRFEHGGLISRRIGARDRRELELKLTPAGRAAIQALEEAVSSEVERWLQPLSERKQRDLLAAMQAIMHLLNGAEGSN